MTCLRIFGFNRQKIDFRLLVLKIHFFVENLNFDLAQPTTSSEAKGKSFCQPKRILVNLSSRAKRDAEGMLVNLSPQAKREAERTLVNLPPRAKREAKGILVSSKTFDTGVI